MTLRTLFVLAIMVPGVFLAFVDRFPALLLYLWFALFRPQEWVWVDISSLRLSLVLGLLLVIPSIFSGVLPNVTHRISRGIIVFLIVSMVSQFSAVNPELGWAWIDYLARLTIVCLLTVTLTSTMKRLVGVVTVIAVSFGFHSAKAGLASLIYGGVRFHDGLAGSFIDNNGYAVGSVMIMPLLIGAGQNFHLLFERGDRKRQPHWARHLFYLAAPLSAFTVISLFSRGGFLALVGAVITFVLVQRRRFLTGSILLLLTALALPFAPLPEGYTERLQTIRTYDDVEDVPDDSTQGRLHFWRVAVVMAIDKPLGVGLRSFNDAYDDYDFLYGRYGRQRAVHSSHFQVLAETGFLGAATYTALFIYAFLITRRIRVRSRRPDLEPEMARFLLTMSNALIISMAGYLVGGAFISMALNDLTWLTFALVASLDRLSLQTCSSLQGADATAQVRLVADTAAGHRQTRPTAALPAAAAFGLLPRRPRETN